MLKKSLIAIAVLAIAMPAFAATQSKFHKPWSQETKTIYHYRNVATIDVCMDVGYWIEIAYEGCIKVSQDATIGDNNPFYNYSGCLSGGITVLTNFNATLKASAAATSAANGNWSAKLNGADTYDVTSGTSTNISVCVTGTDVAIQNLPHADNVKVAEVTIMVIPTEYKDQTSW